MNIGEYVRTDRGYITKISDFEEHYTKGKRLGLKEEVVENFLLLDDKQCEIIESIDYSIPPCYPSDEELEKIKSHIIKSSPNIIELFEEHDLVVIEYFSLRYEERVTRLFEVDYKDEEFITIKNAHCDFMLRNNEFNDEDKKLNPIIKSIVTREQFSQMEYKVKE